MLSSFINFCLFIVSNAEDISIPVICTSKSWYNWTLPIINLCVHTMSPVDRFGLYAAWEDDKYCYTFSCILFKVIIDRIFLLVFNKLIGVRFLAVLFLCLVFVVEVSLTCLCLFHYIDFQTFHYMYYKIFLSLYLVLI